MNVLSRSPACGALALFSLPLAALAAQEPARELPVRPPGVLLILLDDQNDWVGPLGAHPDARTPFLDQLARRGTTFTNAHAAAPVSNASRAALLSGLRPTSTGAYDNRTRWGVVFGEHEVLPAFLRRQKFRTVAYGRVFHHDDETMWDAHHRPRSAPELGEVRREAGLSWLPVEEPESKTADFRTARQVEAYLSIDPGQPFLMACGFVGTHMPWTAPREYFELHAEASLPALRAGDLDDVPEAAFALHERDGERFPDDVPEETRRPAVQAYLAGSSFADAMVGRVLAALDTGPNADNTIIVVTSDHGLHLGEKDHWREFTLWEESTRVPLLIVAPGVSQPGSRCDRPVELTSLYATLAELCGLEPPAGLDGPSLVPLLRDPAADWDHHALTTHGRGNHAVRTERWRYIRYADGSEELYDHANDPHEWTNLAGDPRFEDTRRELARLLPAEEAEPAPLQVRRRQR